MIRNQWYVVLETAEVGTHPIGVTRLGEKLVFWRDQTGSDHQQPKGSGLKIGEILIQGDLPIIDYRRKRAALQNMAERA